MFLTTLCLLLYQMRVEFQMCAEFKIYWETISQAILVTSETVVLKIPDEFFRCQQSFTIDVTIISVIYSYLHLMFIYIFKYQASYSS